MPGQKMPVDRHRPRHADAGWPSKVYFRHFNDMAEWDSFLAAHHGGRDLAEFSLWEIGDWNKSLIYPILTEFKPDFLREILDADFEDHPYLPYSHLKYFHCHSAKIWCCYHCGFWCNLFDQRMMEEHLIIRCNQVSHDYCL